MEDCSLSPVGRNHPWKDATLKRIAWAQSRDSWSPDLEVSTPQTPNKPETASETGPIPNKIACWLRECRTPLGASLDEQYSSSSKGLPKNGCSFEDDLLLGAEANLLPNGSAKPDSSYEIQAKEKRSQFRLKGRSMNSTGSGKSSGTVSSVSELLDLYEEDPEEILYNLGFGREEPDIASKIPSRFFNSSSSANGIDIKVYLGAQMQRMELENPNYALTSRFRQTEVLATVANVFTEIYSHVSGRQHDKICQMEHPKEVSPLRRNSSALNAAKILKKNFTRPNLLSSAEGMQALSSNSTTTDPESQPDSEPKLMKFFRKKDSLSLATVTEESHQVDAEKENPAIIKGQSSQSTTQETEAVWDATDTPVMVNGTKVAKQSNGEIVSNPSMSADGQNTVSFASHPDKEPCSFLPNPHMAHLLNQPRDSFEMEELQSNEDETVPVTCYSRIGSEPLLRTASQQSDSSGFAEDPSTDATANFLKVQESLDSCDSETTVTSYTGREETLEHPAFERLLGEEELLMQPGMGLFIPAEVQQEVPEYIGHQVSKRVMDQTRTEKPPTAGSEIQNNRHSVSVIETSSSTESGSTIESAGPASVSGHSSFPNILNTGAKAMPVAKQGIVGELRSTTEADGSTEIISSSLSSSPTALKPVLESKSVPSSGPSDEKFSSPVPEFKSCSHQEHSNSERVRGALVRAQQRSSSYEEYRGRVWVRSKELLKDLDDRVRNPLQRSSSLPTSLFKPSRVVSSMRIQLGQGSVRHCTPPCYSYCYDEERDADSITEEEDAEVQPGFRSNPTESSSLSLNPETELDSTEMPPYPLNVPQHLTRSASSLYSTPADWPLRCVTKGPNWSTNSVPDLTQHAWIPHPAIPPHIQQEMPHFRESTSSPCGKFIAPFSPSYAPVNDYYPYMQSGIHSQYPQPQNSTFSYSPYTPPHGTQFPQPYTHPQNVVNNSSASFHSSPLSTPYGSTFNLHSSPHSPQVTLTHSYSPFYSNFPYHPNMPYGHQYNTPVHPPSAHFSSPAVPLSGDSSTFPPTMSSTEMQLRRVLHEIRGTVQSLSQNNSSQRCGTPSGSHSPHQVVQPLYEELQRRSRSLNLFRTQMINLELTLMRQQSMVYQLLSPNERHEAEHLQRLRIAVRQELQELELRLEDRLCQHSLNISSGHSMESLSSSSALKATETVSDLLREQMFLQSELSYDGGTPTSTRSSRSASPTSRPEAGVYRSSVSFTPCIASRLGAESQDRTTTPKATSCSTEGRDQRAAQIVVDQEKEKTASGEDAQLQGDSKEGGEEAGGNAYLQQIIQQIKRSLADEIRQEIVSEILSAVSPQQSPAAMRKQTP